jgi:uncharacterized protein (TIGR03435 family)
VRQAILNFCFAAIVCAQGTATFEVASVKASPAVQPGARVYFGPPRGGPGTSDPGQITWTYATLMGMLTTAYDVKAYQINGPGWLTSERYDVAVKLPADATKEQVRAMWQNLLAERFGLKLHHESKEFAVDDLVVGKGGSKLRVSKDETDTAALPGPPKVNDKGELNGPGLVTRIMIGPKGVGNAHAIAKAQTLAPLTVILGNQLGRPVLDKTGLTGKYDFELDFSPDMKGVTLPGAPPPPPAGGAAGLIGSADSATDASPDLTTAVQQQLGLKLVAGKANLDVVMIDRIEKIPTAN